MRFNYKARTEEGEVQKGIIEASSKNSAVYLLEKNNLFVIDLTEELGASFLGINFELKKTSLKDISAFTRQFAVMLKSGISPVEALRSQVAQITNSNYRKKIMRIAETVEGGGSLSQGFAMFPGLFDSFYVSVLKSGEATGKMADSLEYLARHLEREYNFQKQVKGAMIYPAFVVAVFIGVFFLAVFFIMPKLNEILENFSGNLPAVTKIMMKLSELTRQGGWIIVIIILVVLFLLPKILTKRKETRDLYYRFILKVPILGDFQKKLNLTSFAENLSVLISSGLPITQGLKIVKDILKNSVYKNIMAETEDRVAKGEKISAVFTEHSKEIPTFVQQMVRTGEETGSLDESLKSVVGFYREEIERTTDNLTTILEPVLILFLGIGIAVLAVAVFIPLFKVGMGGVGGM